MKSCLFTFYFLLILSCQSKELNDFQRNGLPAHQFITERESFGDNCSIVYLSYWDGKKINRIDSLEGDSYFHFLTEAEKIQVNMPLSYIQVVRASFTNLKRTIVIDSTDNFYSVKMQDNSSRRVEPFVEIKRFYKNTKH